MSYNRAVTVSLRKYNTFAEVGEIVLGDEDFNFIGLENEERLPLEISASFQKTIVSTTDVCSVIVRNPLVLEKLYVGNERFVSELFKHHYSLAIGVGYDSNENFGLKFTGDLTNLSTQGGTSISDKQIVMTATGGYLAYQNARINELFPAETPYRAIVDRNFEILKEEFDIDVVIEDPDGKLDEKVLKKPRTRSRPIHRDLTDICRNTDIDFTWGIDSRLTADGPMKAYFIDKRSAFDIDGLGIGPFDISYETGLLSLPDINMKLNTFSFVHQPDKLLNVGKLVNVSVGQQMNSGIPFSGRINSISANVSNKTGAHTFRVECQFVGADGLAVLPFMRTIAGSEILI